MFRKFGNRPSTADAATLRALLSSIAFPQLPKHLTTALTDAAWEGVTKSDGDNGNINLYSVFAVPKNAKFVLVRLITQDSGAVGKRFTVGPGGSGNHWWVTAQSWSTSINGYATDWCPTNGAEEPLLYWYCEASGASANTVYLRILSYMVF
jgi:hypothetical protein